MTARGRGGRGLMSACVDMLQILINGQARTLEGEPSVAEALDALGLAGRRVAVERNGIIVPRSQHAEQRLREGDRVEIVAAVGGG